MTAITVPDWSCLNPNWLIIRHHFRGSQKKAVSCYSNKFFIFFIFRFYVLAIIILPILFYIPKFFEVRSHSIMWPYIEKVECRDYVRFRWPLVDQNSSSLFENNGNKTGENSTNFDYDASERSSNNLSLTNLPQFHAECSNFNFR